MHLISAAKTDIGCVREENEDRFLHDSVTSSFGVADGIGGLPCGAEAASCAIDTLLSSLGELPRDGSMPDLAAIVKKVNTAVVELGYSMSPERGMGCTLTFGCIRNDTLRIAHVGDSRCYVFADGKLTQLTTDHNVESDPLYKLPQWKLAALNAINRGALTRCIGQPTPLTVDTIDRDLAAGESYLFCSDGISRMIPDEEICQTLSRHAESSPETILEELILTAKRRGGYDNATGVLLQIR